MDLTRKHCVPCGSGGPPLPDKKEDELKRQIPSFALLRTGTHKLRKEFKFKNFNQSISFVNKVAKIAQGEGHHPDIYIFYNKVVLELFTHAVSGLSENDFIMAAKIDKSLSKPNKSI